MNGYIRGMRGKTGNTGQTLRRGVETIVPLYSPVAEQQREWPFN